MYSDYYDSIAKVSETDKEVADAMALELKRQRENIELIASENLVSPQVMAAMGSVLTNKYAEGLPGKRYYGGCQYVDVVEEWCNGESWCRSHSRVLRLAHDKPDIRWE